MTFSDQTNRTITTPNQSSRSGRGIDCFIVHHMATTNGQQVEDMMRTGSKQVSATYIVRNDGTIVGVVPEELRAWSVSNADWDGHGISVETENQTGAPAWSISDAAIDAVARLIADTATRYGFPIDRSRVRGHSEGSGNGHGGSYATACPGGFPLDWLVERANQYQAGTITKREEEDMPIAIAPNTLIWPNGYSNAYRQDIFDAVVWGLGLTVHDTDWTYDTILREAWTASDFMTSRQATAAAGAVSELLKDHEHPTPEEIERAIREALRTAPKPPEPVGVE